MIRSHALAHVIAALAGAAAANPYRLDPAGLDRVVAGCVFEGCSGIIHPTPPAPTPPIVVLLPSLPRPNLALPGGSPLPGTGIGGPPASPWWLAPSAAELYAHFQ